MSTKLLVIDDDESIHVQLQNSLLKNSHEFLFAKTGKEGLEIALKENPALIILEASLAELDGFSVCKLLRAEGYKNPIIFLTNKISEIDAVIGLELGAQDYMRKPLQIKELQARIEVQLKKSQSELTNKKITVQELEIDLERRKVKHKGSVKELTHK